MENNTKELLENFIRWLREQDSLYILSESDEIIKKFLNETYGGNK